MKYPIVIIGGGLAGFSLVRALLKEGVNPRDILLLEQLMPASGSSGVLHGMMHPFTGRTLYPKPGYLEAWKYTLKWLAEVQLETEIELYRLLPLWRIALDATTQKQFERSFIRAQALTEYPMYRLDNLDIWPLKDVVAGYALDQSAQVKLPALIAHLSQQYAIARKYHTGKVRVVKDRNLWCLQTVGQTFHAETLFMATGSGLQDYFPALEVSYKRGEVALFRLPGCLPAAISGGGRYAASLYEGLHMTGATFYHAERSWSTSDSWLDLQNRLRWWPEIKSAQVLQVFSAVRAIVKQDREPLTGPCPDHDNLWIHAAYSTRGLLQIPLASRELAQEFTSGNKQIPERLRPERLGSGCWCPQKLSAGSLFVSQS